MNGYACKVNSAFRTFRKARSYFLDKVDELSFEDTEEKTLLINQKLVGLLMNLIEDPSSNIRNHAAMILGRFVTCHQETAQAMAEKDCIPLFLGYIQNHPSISFRAYIVDILREVCRNDKTNDGLTIYKQNGIHILLQHMCHPREQMRTAVGWALAYMVRNSRTIAEEIVNEGAIPLFLKQVATDKLSVKCAATAVLYDIIQQSEELTETCVKAYCIMVFAKSFKENKENNFKWQRLQTLAVIANYRHSWSEMILQAGIAKYAIEGLRDDEVRIQSVAASLLVHIMKHEEEMAIWIANQNCVPCCLSFIEKVNSAVCKPAVFCIGYMANASSIFAWVFIESKGANEQSGISILENLMNHVKDDETLTGILWTMSAIAKHSTGHTEHVVRSQVMKKCIELHSKHGPSYALKRQCMATLESLLKTCEFVPAMNVLLPGINVNYLRFTVPQYCKIIPVDKETRRIFFLSGALEKLQEVSCEPGSTLDKQIQIINSCYPPDVIKYFNPNFDMMMMLEIENFFPREQDSVDAALIKFVRRAKLLGDSSLEGDNDSEIEISAAEMDSKTKTEESFYFFDEEKEVLNDDLTVGSASYNSTPADTTKQPTSTN